MSKDSKRIAILMHSMLPGGAHVERLEQHRDPPSGHRAARLRRSAARWLATPFATE